MQYFLDYFIVLKDVKFNIIRVRTMFNFCIFTQYQNITLARIMSIGKNIKEFLNSYIQRLNVNISNFFN